MKKLLGSDWLKRSAFLVNTVQKRVTVQKSETRVQITTKISEVKTKTAGGQPTYFEDRRRSCETFRRFPKTVRSLPKITEDHTKPSEDSRRSPEHFRMFPKITRTLPKFTEDYPNTSENFRRSSETFPKTYDNLRRSPKLFQVLDDRTQYLLCTSVVNVWSEALSCPFFQVYY